MSINIDNPKTTLEKMDAASNYVAQIQIALVAGDISHAKLAAEKASRLLFDATNKLIDSGE